MEDVLKKFSSKTCGGFGTGPGSKKLPGCTSAAKANFGRSYTSIAAMFVGGIVGLFILAEI